ncbi:hypothetical protein BGZ65_005683 [Modicella reniformis]|uniref:Uncharacterized protein n=1 Tax=Modicella reniformis TaxID=1440133 RepID=A0A9P6MGF3_9FUNG|nr:hypothetical protein BGZ65_005683 [Modicella reniformis]
MAALKSDEVTKSVKSNDILGELRQLRSKFYDPSTYLLCRALGNLTRQPAHQPYTVFNVAGCDRSNAGQEAAAAVVFNEIGKDILFKGDGATLARNVVVKARDQCSNAGDIRKTLDNILALFNAENSEMPIIGNTQLNKHLEDLARLLSRLLSRFITRANENAMVLLKTSLSPQYTSEDSDESE